MPPRKQQQQQEPNAPVKDSTEPTEVDTSEQLETKGIKLLIVGFEATGL